MRRECTTEEQTILKKNTKHILKGVISSGIGPIIVASLIGLALGAALGTVAALMLPDILMDISFVGDVIVNVLVRVGAFGLMVVAAVIGSRIGARIRMSRIFSYGKFMINGATVTKSVPGSLTILEDDLTDISGTYLEYSLPCGNSNEFKRGDRVLVVIRNDGACFLMRGVGAVGEILKRFFGTDIESVEPSYIFHPNIGCLEAQARQMTDEEKKEFVRKYRHFSKGRVIIGGVCTTILAFIIVGLIFLAVVSVTPPTSVILVEIIVAILAFAGLSAFFIWGLFKLTTRCVKRMTTVKRVIYMGYVYAVGPSYVNVFEMNETGMGSRSLMNALFDTAEKKRFVYGQTVNLYAGPKEFFVGLSLYRKKPLLPL